MNATISQVPYSSILHIKQHIYENRERLNADFNWDSSSILDCRKGCQIIDSGDRISTSAHAKFCYLYIKKIVIRY